MNAANLVIREGTRLANGLRLIQAQEQIFHFQGPVAGPGPIDAATGNPESARIAGACVERAGECRFDVGETNTGLAIKPCAIVDEPRTSRDGTVPIANNGRVRDGSA